jgi:hypothetical protein
MRKTLISRLGLAVGGAAVMAVLGSAAPAQASAAPASEPAAAKAQSAASCHVDAGVARSGNIVQAWRFLTCFPNTEPSAAPVSLYQTIPSTGQKFLVASGEGVVTYVCTGSATRKYSSNPVSNSITTNCS